MTVSDSCRSRLGVIVSVVDQDLVSECQTVVDQDFVTDSCK